MQRTYNDKTNEAVATKLTAESYEHVNTDVRCSLPPVRPSYIGQLCLAVHEVRYGMRNVNMLVPRLRFQLVRKLKSQTIIRTNVCRRPKLLRVHFTQSHCGKCYATCIIQQDEHIEAYSMFLVYVNHKWVVSALHNIDELLYAFRGEEDFVVN
jgi:hypothetical protein